MKKLFFAYIASFRGARNLGVILHTDSASVLRVSRTVSQISNFLGVANGL